MTRWCALLSAAPHSGPGRTFAIGLCRSCTTPSSTPRRRRDAELRREAEATQLADTSFPAEQEGSVYLQQIGRAFFTLPDEHRAALHLVAIEGLAYQEAANALGIPLGTLMSRLSRARAALRAFEEGSRAVAPALPAPPDRPARSNLRVVGGPDD